MKNEAVQKKTKKTTSGRKTTKGPKGPMAWLKKHVLTSVRNYVIFFVVLAVVAVVAVFAVRETVIAHKAPTQSFSSRLFDSQEIDELSTSSFIYNGIAEIYDESGEKLRYSAVYHATVKAGIRMKDIRTEEDAKNKKLKVTLPDVEILTVSVDPSFIDFIPDDAKIDLKEVLAACREDVRKEATQSGKLIETAEENLRTVVEAMTLPLIQEQGYTLEW